MKYRKIIASVLMTLIVPVIAFAVTTIGENISTDGTVTGEELTDGTLHISGGAISSIVSLGFGSTGAPSHSDIVIPDGSGNQLRITDGSNVLFTIQDDGAVGSFQVGNGTISGSLTTNTLTTNNLNAQSVSISGDGGGGGTLAVIGTVSVDGNIDVTGTVDEVDVSEITAMKTSFFNTVLNPGTTTVDEFVVTAQRTLTRMDFYSQGAYQDGDAGDYCRIELTDGTNTLASIDVGSGSRSGTWTGTAILSPGNVYYVNVTVVDNDNTHAATAPTQGNITFHLKQYAITPQ